MVVIHIKNTEEDQFLFECSVDDCCDDVIRRVVKVWNLRLQIQRLCGYCKGVVDHGPAKKPKEIGLDHIEEQAGKTIERGPFYLEDPTGHRTGNRVDPKLAAIIIQTCEDALQAINKVQVAMRVALTAKLLEEKIRNIGGALTIAYPMGLPEWDPARLALTDQDGAEGAPGQKILDPDTATLWFAGKQFERDTLVKERVKQEKSKVVAKLQSSGTTAPAREAAISEEEKKAMMAHYYKKQEELKRVQTNDEDDYLHSAWADSKSMKYQLQGQSTGGIAFRKGGISM
jgi:hypothetical protein